MEPNPHISRRRFFIVLAIAGAALLAVFIVAAIIRNRAAVNEMRLSGIMPNLPTPSPGTVLIKNFMFIPNRVVVKKGDRITWINNDDVSHTVTSQALGGQHVIGPGGTLTIETDVVPISGEISYRCDFHPDMKGTIALIRPGTEGYRATYDTLDAPTKTCIAGIFADNPNRLEGFLDGTIRNLTDDENAGLQKCLAGNAR